MGAGDRGRHRGRRAQLSDASGPLPCSDLGAALSRIGISGLGPSFHDSHRGPLDDEAWQDPFEPVRDPPVAVPQQLHDGRDEHHPDEGGVEEDRSGEPDPEQLSPIVPPLATSVITP
jgi:hypothetical protein